MLRVLSGAALVLTALFATANMALSREWETGEMDTGWQVVFSLIKFNGVFTQIMNYDGSDMQMLAFEGTTISYPTCSPDGNYFAFIASESVYMMRADGSDLRRVYTSPSSPFAWTLSISNEGEIIALTGSDPGGSGGLATAIINTETLQTFTLDTDLWFSSIHLDVSPDGNQIVLQSGEGDIYIISADGMVLTHLPTSFAGAVWSPGGSMIAITTRRLGAYYISLLDIERLVQVPLTNLTNGQAVGAFSSWSPDGRQILYIKSMPQEEDDRNLYIMNSDGTGQRSLTQFPLRVNTSCFLTSRPISLAVEINENPALLIPTLSP